jgi:protein CpxP
MRTIVLMLSLVLLGGTMNFATAQDKTKQKRSAEEMATKRTTKLTEVLKLSDTQKDQVYNLILANAKEMDKVNNTKLTQDERKAAMKELSTSLDSKLQGVLTAAQYKTFLAHKEEMHNDKKGTMGGCCSEGGGSECPHGKGAK